MVSSISCEFFDSSMAEFLFMDGSKYYSIPVKTDDLYVDSIGWILASYKGHVAIYDFTPDKGNTGHVLYRIGNVFEQNFRQECQARKIEFEVLDEPPEKKRRKIECEDIEGASQKQRQVLLSLELPAASAAITIENLVITLRPQFQ